MNLVKVKLIAINNFIAFLGITAYLLSSSHDEYTGLKPYIVVVFLFLSFLVQNPENDLKSTVKVNVINALLSTVFIEIMAAHYFPGIHKVYPYVFNIFDFSMLYIFIFGLYFSILLVAYLFKGRFRIYKFISSGKQQPNKQIDKSVP